VDTHGADTLFNLERIHGDLPATWVAQTGSGGYHYWFRMPNADVRNSASSIGPGIDVRANGGYVVAPPSLHKSGYRYKWTESWHPDLNPIADVPDWLLKKMAPAQMLRSSNPLPKIITEGMRNTWMASAAGAMRRKGFGESAIAAALRAENRERCKPPLDDREIERIARSIERYAPAPTFTAGGRFLANA
jgi:putative DNA primase/helicase